MFVVMSACASEENGAAPIPPPPALPATAPAVPAPPIAAQQPPVKQLPRLADELTVVVGKQSDLLVEGRPLEDTVIQTGIVLNDVQGIDPDNLGRTFDGIRIPADIYRVVPGESIENERIVLEKLAHVQLVSGGPDPKRVVFIVVPEMAVQRALYLTGEVNAVYTPTFLPSPVVRAAGQDVVAQPDVPFRAPFFIEIDFEASSKEVVITSIALDGDDLTDQVRTPDNLRFLTAVADIGVGDHTLAITAEDDAGINLDGPFEVVFTVEARDTIALELNPGWNLVSVPREPADPSIDAVLGDALGVSTVVTFDPAVPGGFLVAVRDPNGNFAGTVTTIRPANAYWVLTDKFEPIELDVPGLVTSSTRPSTLSIVKGWNLVPVLDVTGTSNPGDRILAKDYFASAEDVTEAYFFDMVANQWEFVDTSSTSTATVEVGSAVWAFSADAGNLILEP